jgi:DNA-directed RNA polymerase specialized sigma24 family protein
MAEGDDAKDGRPKLAGDGPAPDDTIESDSAAPPSDKRLGDPMTEDEFFAYLSAPKTRGLMEKVIRLALAGASDQDREDVLHDAFVKTLESSSRPRCHGTASGWLTVVMRRQCTDYLRKTGVRRRVLEDDAEIDERPGGDVPDGPGPDWLIADWLRTQVADNERDRETYELLLHCGRTGASYAEVAEELGFSKGAIGYRVHTFKAKYEPRWRKRRQMFMLLILFGAAVVVGLVIAILRLRRAYEPVIGPDTEPFPFPAPTASENPFNQALPDTPPSPPDGGWDRLNRKVP